MPNYTPNIMDNTKSVVTGNNKERVKTNDSKQSTRSFLQLLNIVNTIFAFTAAIASLYISVIASSGALLWLLISLAICQFILKGNRVYYFFKKLQIKNTSPALEEQSEVNNLETQTLKDQEEQSEANKTESVSSENKSSNHGVKKAFYYALQLAATTGDIITRFLSIKILMINLGYGATLAITVSAIAVTIANLNDFFRNYKAISDDLRPLKTSLAIKKTTTTLSIPPPQQ